MITAPRQVIVDKPVTAGTVNFLGAFRYTLAGPATLEIDSPTAGAINVLSGSHTITVPLLLSRNTTVTVGQGTSTLSVLGNVTAAATVTLTKAGRTATVTLESNTWDDTPSAVPSAQFAWTGNPKQPVQITLTSPQFVWRVRLAALYGDERTERGRLRATRKKGDVPREQLQ